jgi:hypothetical protein
LGHLSCFVSARARCPLRGASPAAGTEVGLGLLRVEVGDDGEYASVVVWRLREAQGAEDVFDVFLDGVVGEPHGQPAPPPDRLVSPRSLVRDCRGPAVKSACSCTQPRLGAAARTWRTLRAVQNLLVSRNGKVSPPGLTYRIVSPASWEILT